MIRLPKKVGDLMRLLEERGVKAYVTGEAAALSMLNKNSSDWDMIAIDRRKSGENIGIILGTILKKASIAEIGNHKIRVDFTEGEGDKESPVIDIDFYTEQEGEGSLLEKILKDQVFTYKSMAFDAERNLTDPYGGNKNMESKLIACMGDPRKRFESEPILMMEAVRFAAENDFDIQKNLYEIIVEMSSHLENADKRFIRENLEAVVTAPNAGKGLKMLAGSNLMPAIIGHEAAKLNKRQRNRFSVLCDNIDKTQPVRERRLGLLYSCFEDKKGMKAIEHLDYDEKTKQHLADGLKLTDRMHFIRYPHELKDFLVEVGQERYEYMDNLSKAERIVFDGSGIKILSRYHMLKLIKEAGEPIWVEDLAIDVSYLVHKLEMSREEAEKMLIMLTDVVHRKPGENTPDKLLKYAMKFKKNKFAASTRRIKWLR